MTGEQRARVRRNARWLRWLLLALLLTVPLPDVAQVYGLGQPWAAILLGVHVVLITGTARLLGRQEAYLWTTPLHLALRVDPPVLAGEVDPRDFVRYAERHAIRDEELPAAFAAWLHERTGWDGTIVRVDPATGEEL